VPEPGAAALDPNPLGSRDHGGDEGGGGGRGRKKRHRERERERERRVVQCTNSSHFATFGLLLLSNGAFSLASVPLFENRLFRGKKNHYYYYYYSSFWNRFVGITSFGWLFGDEKNLGWIALR
jgi:hypothetical protein